jgi:photosystem II stability/assembly factor-like uncharacterized protein
MSRTRLSLFILVLLIDSSVSINAQWFEQNNPAQNNSLNDIFVFDEYNVIVVGGAGSILKTNDGGENWLALPHDTTDSPRSIYFVNNSIGWIAGFGNGLNEGSIQKTTDGGNNWISQYNGGWWELFYSIHFADENNGWAAGVYSGDGPPMGVTYKTVDGGVNWMSNGSGGFFLGSCTSVFFINIDTGWVIGGNLAGGKITKTTDNGDTWFEQTISGTNGLWDICFTDDNNGWLVGEGGSYPNYYGLILKTTDGGATWFTQITGLTDLLNSIYFTDEYYGWAVGDNGIILATTDGGLNWITQVSETSNDLYSVHFADENTGWVAGGNGTILKTTNGGGTIPVELTSFTATAQSGYVELNWSTATETNNMTFEIERRKENSEFVLIGFVEGNGTTTKQQEYSYVDRNVTTGKYFYRLNQIDFNGTFEYSYEVEVDAAPVSFSLEQNYPNPFNPSTTIKFNLPEKEFVTLKVYDVMGKEIAILLNEEKPAGSHSIEFDASDLASGSYFYKLQAGNNITTRKMILLK